MQCPVCTDVALAISSRDGVEIDYCPQCRGVWLDRGELDKIIDRAGAVGVGGRQQQPRDEERRYEGERRDHDDRRYDDDRRYGKRKRRGGFLEDLFDFD